MKQYRSLMAALLMGSVFAMSSCLKKDFETPPDTSGYDPALPVNMKIRDLKAKFIGPASTKIDSNWTVYGIVTADDRSGNFYKQINIEDSTGGITLLLDNNSLYNEYPVGRKVYVKLQGLYFGFYSKLPQIGAQPDATGSMSSLTPAAISEHIVKANYPNTVTPQTVTLAQIKATNTAYLNRLVKLENVEIVSGDLGKTYADPPTLSSGTSITVEDCNGNKIAMRTSGYANFQSYKLPQGKGSIVALYTTYNSTPQLVIRDTSDLKFYDARCGGGSNPSGSVLVSLDSVRKLYTGADKAISGLKMKGIVISDASAKNTSAGNIVVQDGNRGILVYFGGTSAPFALGDSVVIELDGSTITKYQGQLEIKNITTAKITKVASGKTVAPAVMTISQLLADFANRESTLVRINNATITGGGTYSGNKTLSDGSGTVILYTATGATFATTAVPTTPKSFTGIVTPYQPSTGSPVNEVKLRNLDDVQ